MPTPYTNIYNRFSSKINDPVFFGLSNVTQLSEQYLLNAIPKFTHCQTDLTNRDSVNKQFNLTLSDTEEEILAVLVTVEYFNSQVASLDLVKQGFSNKDWSMTSQANHMNALIGLRQVFKDEAELMMNRYSYDFTDLSGLT